MNDLAAADAVKLQSLRRIDCLVNRPFRSLQISDAEAIAKGLLYVLSRQFWQAKLSIPRLHPQHIR